MRGRNPFPRYPLVFLAGLILILGSSQGLAQEFISEGGTRDYDNTLEIGDPISGGSGAYLFTMSLLDLNGPMELEFRLIYRTDLDQNILFGFLPFGFWFSPLSSAVTRVSLNGRLYSTFQLPNANTVSFKLVDGEWVLVDPDENVGFIRYVDNGSSTRFVMEETADFAYLMDPTEELVYVYEEFRNSEHRIKRILDRNGNQLIYSYLGNAARDQLPIRIEDGLGRSLDLVYDGQGRLVSVTDMAERQVTFGYNNNLLVSLTDPLGQVTRLSYEPNPGGLITGITLPAGNTPFQQAYAIAELNSSSVRRAVSQTDAFGNTTTFEYDADASVVAVRLPDGSESSYEHFSHHSLPSSIRDAAGNSATFEKSEREQLTAITDRVGERYLFAYDSESGKPASVTNPLGDTITRTYEAQQQTFFNPDKGEQIRFAFQNPTRTEYPDSTSEALAFDDRGNTLTAEDGNGEEWIYEYNTRGQVSKLINPAGGEIFYTYDEHGNLESERDTETGTTTFQYDNLNRLNRIVHPDNSTIDLTLDANDRLTMLTFEDNAQVTYSYDKNGSLLSITHPDGAQTSNQLDELDKVTSRTDADGNTTTYSYDSLNRINSITDANGNAVQYGYDLRGPLSEMSDGEGHTWRWTYDEELTLESEMTPQGNATTFDYNEVGWITAITDPLGNAGHLEYDSLGRVTSMRDRLDRATGYAYDGVGSVTNLTRPLIGTATFARDEIRQLTQLTDFMGHAWLFSSTPMGRLQSHTDPVGNQWTYRHDQRGRLAAIDYQTGESLIREFDVTGQEAAWRYSDGTEIAFEYDATGKLTETAGLRLEYSPAGQLVTTRHLLNGTAPSEKSAPTGNGEISFGGGYDPAGRLERVSYNNGSFEVLYSYDKRDLVTRVEDTLTNSFVELSYDDDGELVEIRRSNSIKTVFERDANARPTRILTEDAGKNRIAELQHTFNLEGEVTETTTTAPLEPGPSLERRTDQFAYDAASQVASEGYRYDGRGRLEASPFHSFTWDAASRIQRIDGLELSYNGLSDLTASTRDGATNQYFYNYALSNTPIMAERTASGGQFLRFYVWTPGGALLYGIDAAADNSPFFYHFDRMGSTLFLTDEVGAVTDSYAYSPYGIVVGHTGASDQPFTYVGQYGVKRLIDSIFMMGKRLYDAVSARFLSRDPIGLNLYDSASLNLYQYGGQDPVNSIDPLGEGTWNKDRTTFFSKTGRFVQTQQSQGNFLGGWKWVPYPKKKDNPSPQNPTPPRKQQKVDKKENNDAPVPQENPRETLQNSPEVTAPTTECKGISPPQVPVDQKPPNRATETKGGTSSSPTDSGSRIVNEVIRKLPAVPEALGKNPRSRFKATARTIGKIGGIASIGTDILAVVEVSLPTAQALLDQQRTMQDLGIDPHTVYPGRRRIGRAAGNTVSFFENLPIIGWLFKPSEKQ